MADIFHDVRNLSPLDIRHFIEANFGNAYFQNDGGQTLLHFAALFAENIEVIEILISMGAVVDAKDNDGLTPLGASVKMNSAEIAKILLSKGANPNSKDSTGLTPFDMAILYGKVDIVNVLLSHGIDINSKDEFNLTPLHKAAVSRNTAGGKNIEIAKLLVSKRANISAKSPAGETPLDLARKAGDTIMVQYLSNISIRDRGFTDIFSAIKEGTVKDVKQFVEEKCGDIDVSTKDGFTPLHFAVLGKNIEIVEYLVSTGMEIDIKGENDSTPLNIAACAGNIEAAKFFISKGANVMAQTNDGITPLHGAAMISGNVEIAKILVQAGADVNASDNKGITPLHSAAMSGHIGIAKYLVSEGANVNVKNNVGLTPFDIAKQGGNTSIVQYLLQHISPEERERHVAQEKKEREERERLAAEEQERYAELEKQEKLEIERREAEEREQQRIAAIKKRQAKIGRATVLIIFTACIVVFFLVRGLNSNMEQPITEISVPTVVYATVTSSSLNVRSGPSPTYSIQSNLHENAKVVILERNEGNLWVRIRYGDNNIGYVNSNFLSY